MNGAAPRPRIAALFGVAMLVTGSFAGWVAQELVVRGDAIATATNFAASPGLVRFGIVAGLTMMIAWIPYGLLLYNLLRPVNKTHAQIMLAFVMASVPIYMLSQTSQYAVLVLAADRQYEQVKLFLELHRFGNLVASIFFALWLYPLGLLVYRSGFLPKFIGLLLMLGTPGYLVVFVQGFLTPGADRGLWSSPLLMVTHVSELALLLWLLIKGVNVAAWERRAIGNA